MLSQMTEFGAQYQLLAIFRSHIHTVIQNDVSNQKTMQHQKCLQKIQFNVLIKSSDFRQNI